MRPMVSQRKKKHPKKSFFHYYFQNKDRKAREDKKKMISLKYRNAFKNLRSMKRKKATALALIWRQLDTDVFEV